MTRKKKERIFIGASLVFALVLAWCLWANFNRSDTGVRAWVDGTPPLIELPAHSHDTPAASRVHAWEGKKRELRTMFTKVLEYHNNHKEGGPKYRAELETYLDREIWAKLEASEEEHAKRAKARIDQIEEKVRLGDMNKETADDLIGRTKGSFFARMYFMYGNFGVRALAEVDGLLAKPQEILGDALKVSTRSASQTSSPFLTS